MCCRHTPAYVSHQEACIPSRPVTFPPYLACYAGRACRRSTDAGLEACVTGRQLAVTGDSWGHVKPSVCITGRGVAVQRVSSGIVNSGRNFTRTVLQLFYFSVRLTKASRRSVFFLLFDKGTIFSPPKNFRLRRAKKHLKKISPATDFYDLILTVM